MLKRHIDSIEACNILLKDNRYFANGKNVRVDHLYATAASSRWLHENLWGVYLAKSAFTWTALWIAIASRTQLRKRQLRYYAPDIAAGDYIGRVGIFNPHNYLIDNLLCEEAYLYLFDPRKFWSFRRLDISDCKEDAEKESALTHYGFKEKMVHRRGRHYKTFVHPSNEAILVDIDEWQAAILNVEKLIPSVEIILTRSLIAELAPRIVSLSEEVGRDYLAL